MKPKFSIITPNYNSFHLMNRFFDSLENQTFKDFEVLIIDDCSTDDSYEKLLEYKKNSKLNLKIFKNQKNNGPGLARNIGIDEASGEYLTFMDNDDWVDLTLLEEINKISLLNQYDCIIYDYYLDFGDKTIRSSSVYGDYNGKIEKHDAITYVRNHSVCKFYKLDIIKNNKIKYPAIRRHEDIAFVGSVLTKCNSFYYLKKNMYHYVQRKKSLSKNNFIDEKTLDDAFEMLKQNYAKKYSKELKEKSVLDLLYNKVLIMCKNHRKYKNIKLFINNYEKYNSNWYSYNIVNYVGKSKKIFLFLIKYKFILTLKLLSFIHTLLGG